MLKWVVYRYMPPRYHYTYQTNIWLWRGVGVLSLFTWALAMWQLINYAADSQLIYTDLIASAIVLGGLAGLGIVFGWRINEARRDILRDRLQSYQSLVVIVISLVLFAIGANIRWDTVHTLTTLLATFSGLLFYFSLFDAKTMHPVPRSLVIIGSAMAVLVMLVRLYGLSYWPLPHTDEPWIMSYFEKGVALGQLAQGYYYGLQMDVDLAIGILYQWSNIFGNELWIIRLYNVLLYPLIIGSIYIITRAMYGRWTALLAGIIAFCSFTLHSTTMLRHDASFILFISVALLVYMYAYQHKRDRWHFGAGLVVGLCWYLHYHAILAGPIIGLAFYVSMLLRRDDNEHITWRSFAVYVAGGLIGATIVFVTTKLPYLDVLMVNRAARTPETIALYGENALYYLTSAWFNSTESILLIFGLVGVLYKPNRFDIAWSLFLVSFVLAFGFFASLQLAYYTTHVVVAFVILTARLMTKLWDHLPNDKPPALVTTVFIFASVLGSTSPFFALIEGHPIQRATPSVAAWIRDNIEEGAIVISHDWHYPYLYDRYTVYTSLSGVSTSGQRLAETEVDLWDAVDFDVFVYDPNALGADLLIPFINSDYFDERDYEQVTLPADDLPRIPSPPDRFDVDSAGQDVTLFVREGLLE